MKRVLFAVLLVSVSIPGLGQTALNEDPGNAIKRLQHELIDGYIHRDQAVLNRIMADDYVFIDDTGAVITKAQMIASFRTGERRMTSYQMHDENVRVYGDAAVLTYRYVSQEEHEGRDDSGERRLTRVFVKGPRGWQMVSGQETRIAR